jgi:hypothetical protein
MEFDDLKHAQRERLIYLDRCFTWRAMANRRDLMLSFRISSAQAALDFRLYLERATTPPAYDPVRKTYVAVKGHQPLVPSSLTEAFESVFNPEGDSFSAALPRPERRADPAIVSRLYQAMKATRALHIQYTSLSSGADESQWIAPTHFTFDGESVHLRAYSFKHEQYRDYLPIRIDPNSTFKTRPGTEPLPEDKDWNTRARIWLRPKTGLTPRQAAVVRREYGFDGELLCVETRKALEFYLDRRWGLDQPGARLERSRTDYKHLDC